MAQSLTRQQEKAIFAKFKGLKSLNELKGVPLPSPNTLEVSKKRAELIKQKIAKHIGEPLVLSGGGSFGEQDIVKLKNVKLIPVNKKFSIQTTLDGLGAKGVLFEQSPDGKKKDFEPFIFSWKLAKLERKNL